MTRISWHRLSLIERIRLLRYLLPPVLALVVILYQLGVAQALQRNYGHTVHYSVEIGFYSLVGPVATLLTLIWVERRLQEKEQLERQVQAHAQQLASLTALSTDAILTLDEQGGITSWNQGAERMLNYPAASIIGQPLARFLPEADNLAVRMRQQGVVTNFETAAVTRGGRTLTVELTQTRLVEAQDEAPVSLIIMRDVTARRERETILEEERARIARDLHDGVAQMLYFLALKADMARQQITTNPDNVSLMVKEIGKTARQVIREVRRTIFALRPLEWSDDGFLPALRSFVNGFAEQVGWEVSLDVDHGFSVPPRLEPTLFRLVQESLNNVAKHARADQVWVTLRTPVKDDQLSLIVRDNGGGFDPEGTGSRGMGLRQMKARVASAGGSFQVDSQPGVGTTIQAKLSVFGEAYE